MHILWTLCESERAVCWLMFPSLCQLIVPLCGGLTYSSVWVCVCVCVWEKGGGCLPWWKLLLTRSFNDRSEVATDRHRDRPPLNPQPSVPPHLHTRLPTHSRIIADWFHIVIIREETSGAGWVHTLLMEQTNFCLDYSLYAECYTERIIGDFLHKEHKY